MSGAFLLLAAAALASACAVYGAVYGLGRIALARMSCHIAAPLPPLRLYETPDEIAIKAARQYHRDALAWLALGEPAMARALREDLAALDLSMVFDGGRQMALRVQRLAEIDAALALAGVRP